MTETKDSENRLSRILLLVPAICALAINPSFSIDPINSVKMYVLIFGVSVLIFVKAVNSISAGHDQNVRWYKLSKRSNFPMLSLTFLVLLANPILSMQSDIADQFLGVMGRNTGYLTYAGLVILSLFSFQIFQKIDAFSLISTFCRVGYLISSYSLIQLLDIDPISWNSQSTTGFSTLGNINFASAFFGISGLLHVVLSMRTEYYWSKRSWHFLWSIVNVYLIFAILSSQGLLIFAVGIAGLLLIKIAESKISRLRYIFSYSVISCLGFLGILGLFGLGPLGKILFQATLIFRSDYWSAGIQMMRYKPWTGIGLDNFGNYYRQFRSSEATFRTDANRVTDTAHNVFIDVGAGAGILASICLMVLFISPAITILSQRNKLRELAKSRDNFAVEIFLIYLMFLCQMFFSINQIAIAAWNWVFLGAMYSTLNKVTWSQSKLQNVSTKNRVSQHDTTRKLQGKYEKSRQKTRVFAFLSLFILLISSSLVITRGAIMEYRFLVAYRTSNLTEMFEIASQSNAPRNYMEITIIRAYDLKNSDVLSRAAREALIRNKRSFRAIEVMAIEPGLFTSAEHARAVLLQEDIDPFHPGNVAKR